MWAKGLRRISEAEEERSAMTGSSRRAGSEAAAQYVACRSTREYDWRTGLMHDGAISAVFPHYISAHTMIVLASSHLTVLRFA